VDSMIEGSDVELILNITIPAAHGPVALRALQHGKHVYNEKPLAVTMDQARELNQVAAQKGLRVG
ncbi:MAG: Gfo/Idh/MocA family oxidoreductase, partial [Armatimonadota bacterium]